MAPHSIPSAFGAGTDHGDFDSLYRASFPFVWRCLRALGVPESALDDAAQEVFVTVHRRLSEFRGDSTVETWIYAIVRRVASNHRRSAQRRREIGPLDAALPSEIRDPHGSLEDREELSFVRKFAAGLDDKKRDVFVLALVEGLTIPEVAQILELPLATAYSRLRTVRLEFQSAYEGRKAQS